ncbi:MAG TPA: hypothetical protein PLR90_05710 [Methylophilus sp.]|nr:hypothetical protein [Methylophilus sp.]HQQ33393.1 hypothetical protein [Methylophilus sp.]
MKNILSRLLGRKSGTATNPIFAWLDELADMTDLDVLRHSTKKIQIVMEDEAVGWEQKIDWLITLEEHNQPRLDRLATQYVTVENLKAEIEANINDTCYMYCRQSYVAHLKSIEKSIIGGSTPLDEHERLTLIFRTVYIAKDMVKWRMFNQSAAPAKVWLQIYTLMQFAQKQGILTTTLSIFPDSPSTSLSALLVQTMMLGELIQESPNRHQVEIANKVLSQWLTRAHISSVYTPQQYVFYINIEEDYPAKRLRSAVIGEQYRYWELDDLDKQLQVGITVTDRGEMPQSLVPAHIDSVRKLNETLKIMLAEWTKSNYVRQRRKEPREAVSKSAKVIAGIEKVCNQVLNANRIANGLRGSLDGKSLDDRLLAHTTLRESSTLVVNSSTLDTWVITDESEKGMGMRVNKYSNILVRPDRLIGIANDEDPSKVALGVIRSVRATMNNQLRVSVEILSRTPKAVQLRFAPGTEMFGVTGSFKADRNYRPSSMDTDVIQGIFLPPDDKAETKPMLVLPKVQFQSNRDYLVTMNGTITKLRLEKPIASVDDWVKVALPAQTA